MKWGWVIIVIMSMILLSSCGNTERQEQEKQIQEKMNILYPNDAKCKDIVGLMRNETLICWIDTEWYVGCTEKLSENVRYKIVWGCY